MKYIFLISTFFGWTLAGNLVPCMESVESKVCFKEQDYVRTVNPQPLPTQINIIISVFDIIDVDEAQQTVTLMLKIVLEWQDYRLDVNRTIEESERYVLLIFYFENVWSI